jgi:hypothetical protein
MVGDTGSNRITPSTTSDIVANFDATLSFPVDRDISAATQATLVVNLLDTNVALGDPEAFYDYSNGFEDVAIVTAADAAYLDDLAAGVASAPLVLPAETYFTDSGGGKAYYPSLTGYYLAAYEDLFPNRGDYDFNDLVVGYRVYTDLATLSLRQWQLLGLYTRRGKPDARLPERFQSTRRYRRHTVCRHAQPVDRC